MLSKCKSIFDCKSQAETEFADGSTNAAYPHLIYLTSIELLNFKECLFSKMWKFITQSSIATILATAKKVEVMKRCKSNF